MTASFVARMSSVALLASSIVALAQTQPPAQTPSAAAPAQRAVTSTVPLDRVIAVVNDEALTQWDLKEQRRIVLDQLKASNVQAPSSDVLDKQVLERLITERALNQFAKETGIRV